MTIEAMKQALDALENHTAIEHPQQRHYRDSAITALRAAIEQAEKPWVKTYSGGQPQYITPEKQLRRWQRLTEEETARRESVNPIRVRIMQEAYDLADRDDSEGYNSVKVMCSEVLGMINKLLEPVCAHGVEKTKCPFCQPLEQEPVAWMWADGTITTDPDRADGTWTPLYTAPRQWQGLTDEEIINVLHPLVITDLSDEATDYEIARAIEAKLKEKNT